MSDSPAKKRYLCIHGHFYQPPRENPWLGEIERQPTAAPFHDWNERVHAECYGPNTAARIVDDKNQILDIRNNFERISFNFGPTLLAWMEARAPETYQRVIEADRASCVARGGHGNALAQVYNHIIMPLAARRDRWTQIVWGLEDFRRRFGRDPEGMWLSETAVDLETLEILVSLGVKFTILAPHQAARFRAPGAKPDREWRDCAKSGGIDPTRPYACRLPNGQSIVLFFYDGPVSRAVAFEGLLADGVRFAARIMQGFRDDRDWPQLVHIATDGESYGHHHRFGDMALVYALHHIESHGLARLTNYGEYLERHPPTAEAEIAENTSWSCGHGVERWRSDCGCATGGNPAWRQTWRASLRRALDRLKERLDATFEREAAAFARDPWAARDAYIRVALDGGDEALRAFLDAHAVAPLDPPRVATLLRLLDMQQFAMLMFTSCGWFFDELSGIETVQNLCYALRAIEIAKPFEPNLEAEFLADLAQAPSNVMRDGREVWLRLVKPAAVDPARIVASFLMTDVIEGRRETTRLYGLDLVAHHSVREGRAASSAQFAATTLVLAQIRCRSLADRSDVEYTGAVLDRGGIDIVCAIAGPMTAPDFSRMCDDVLQGVRRGVSVASAQAMQRHFGSKWWTIDDLFAPERDRVLTRAAARALAPFEPLGVQLYESNRSLMRVLRAAGLPAPSAFSGAAHDILHAALARALDRFLDSGERASLDEGADELRSWNLPTSVPAQRVRLQSFLDGAAERLGSPRTDDDEAGRQGRAILNALDAAELLGVSLDVWRAQNACFARLYGRVECPSSDGGGPPSARAGAILRTLAIRLRIAPASPLAREKAAPKAG